jgi:hypothetical protein
MQRTENPYARQRLLKSAPLLPKYRYRAVVPPTVELQ